MKRLALIFLLLGCLSARAQDVNVTPSPNGAMEAFTRANDLYVRNLADSSEVRLTFDGSETTLNGYASWVYYEEILGRPSRYRAFWWSPDSRRLAFFRFDNAAVPVFPIYSPFGQNGRLSLTRYPKAGEQNPDVRVGIVDATGGEVTWADFPESPEQYFGTPFWGADSEELYVSREPRRQSLLELFAVKASDGSKRLVYSESYPTWVTWIEGMLFTSKGLYMARNFETGWEQIYFLGYDGTLERLTDGQNWDISLIKADEATGDLWFTAKRDSRIHQALYHRAPDGTISALTSPEYNVMAPRILEGNDEFSARVSNARTPVQEVSGKARGSISEPKVFPTVIRSEGPFPEIATIEHDGYTLYGLISKPRGFNPRKKYPVLMQLYGGPGTPYVRDRWQDRDSQDRWCWENGIIYIVVDPRSSGENGRRGMDEAFGRMTVVELGDYCAWARWLQGLPYVDGKRIGVEGFSFGGTTTSMLVLRHPEFFCCGIAGGGVYDWMLYDSHYTERFMDTPQANPAGYKEASVLPWVADSPLVKTSGLHNGTPALKLTHGTGDDNVHFQNTLQLIDALQRAGIQFDLMIYPDGMHGYRGHQHTHDKESDHLFWTRHLLK